MRISPIGLQLIKQYEGFRSKPYKCAAGYWTIGYGSRFVDGQEVTSHTRDISEPEAASILAHDINNFSMRVMSALDYDPSQSEFDAMVSLAYNIGAENFIGSTLVDKFNDGDTLGAAMEFQRWSLIKGVRSLGLLRRRLDEARVFLED